MSSRADLLAPQGLRERKKAKTRAAIQEHALRLFHEQGYEETTVEQIAAAAEVSQSTFFRYFATKEDVAVHDPYDPPAIEAFRAQPKELSAVAAIRAALKVVYDALPPAQLERERQRQALIVANPALRARVLDQLFDGFAVLAELIAERTGRRPDDADVRTLAGAVLGVGIATWLGGGAESADLAAFDAALERLDRGFGL